MNVKEVPLAKLMARRDGTVDPSRHPGELFELYSIPAFDLGRPDLVEGSGIGSAKQVVRPGDVLLSRIVPHIRRAWVVGPATDRRIIASGEWIVFRSSDADSRYMRHFLTCDLFHRQFMATVAGVGGSLVRARPAQVAEIRMPLPAPREQRRIADILDKADAIRRKRKETIALTEELLRSAFLDIVGPGARAYRDWPVKTIASLAASQPNAMRTGPFGSDLRHSEFVNEGVAVLGIDNAVQNRFAWGERRFITPEKYDRLRRYTVNPGDVIVTIMGTTGRSAVVPADISTAITTKHLATITLDRGQAEPEFVAQALFRHPDVLRQIKSANRGAIMSGLNLGLIKALQLRVPPPKCQREFSQIVRKARLMADRMADQHLEEDLFGSLAAQAFSEAGRKAGSTC